MHYLGSPYPENKHGACNNEAHSDITLRLDYQNLKCAARPVVIINVAALPFLRDKLRSLRNSVDVNAVLRRPKIQDLGA